MDTLDKAPKSILTQVGRVEEALNQVVNDWWITPVLFQDHNVGVQRRVFMFAKFLGLLLCRELINTIRDVPGLVSVSETVFTTACSRCGTVNLYVISVRFYS